MNKGRGDANTFDENGVGQMKFVQITRRAAVSCRIETAKQYFGLYKMYFVKICVLKKKNCTDYKQTPNIRIWITYALQRNIARLLSPRFLWGSTRLLHQPVPFENSRAVTQNCQDDW